MLRRVLPVLMLIVLVLAFFQKLVSGRYVWFENGADIVYQVLPWMEFQARALRSGQIPLWDPNVFAGEPVLGRVQPGLLNFLQWPLIAWGAGGRSIGMHALDLYFVALHCLAAVCAYCAFREIRAGIWAAGIGGLFYSIGGVTGNVSWPQVVTGLLFPPLVFLFQLRSLRGARPLFNAALAGLFLGLSWWSGHHAVPMLLTYATPACLLVMLARLRGRRKDVLSRGAVCLGVAALVSSIQILAAFEFGRHSMRWIGLDDPIAGFARVPYAAHLLYDVRPSHLIGMLIPGDLTLANSYSGWLFAGIVALTLVAIALTRLRTDPMVRFFALLAAIALALSFAHYNPVHWVAYWIVPFFDKLREAVFALTLFHFAMAALAAQGADILLSGQGPQKAAKWSLILSGIAEALGMAHLIIQKQPSAYAQLHHIDNGMILTAGITLLVAALLFVMRGGRIHKTVAGGVIVVLMLVEHSRVSGHSPQTQYTRVNDATASPHLHALRNTAGVVNWLKAQPDWVRFATDHEELNMNLGDYSGLADLSGSEPAVIDSLVRLGWWQSNVMRLYGVRYYVSRKPLRPEQAELFQDASGLKVFSNGGTLPRAWTVHQTESVPAGVDIGGILQNSGIDIAHSALFEGVKPPQVESCGGSDTVAEQENRLNSVRLQVTMECRGLVIFNQNAYPGWKAYVDNGNSPVYTAYGALQSVVVGTGSHIIELKYRPATLYLGTFLAAAGGFAVLALAIKKEPPGVNLLDLPGSASPHL